MRAFEEPIVEVVEFSVEDIVTTSGEPDLGNLVGDNCI